MYLLYLCLKHSFYFFDRSTKEQKKKNTTTFCHSENIVYLCAVLLAIVPGVQDILIAHFSTESPPRKEESELLNKRTRNGVCAIGVDFP